MKKTELAPSMRRRRYSRWMYLILASMIGVGVGINPGAAAPVNANPTQTVIAPAAPQQRVLTKASKRAALKKAAEAIDQAPAATPQAPATNLTYGKGRGDLQ